MGQVVENLTRVRERIAVACDRAGRDPAEVRLMAVSKTQPVEVLREAYDAGLRLFGENRVQEAADKAESLADLADLEWAMIGHLQTNKARDVAGFAREVARYGALRVRGLMTLAVFSANQDAVAACFARMRALQADLRAAGAPGRYDELSMGMSGDFELAIGYGATTVRVGEAIFGPRR